MYNLYTSRLRAGNGVETPVKSSIYSLFTALWASPFICLSELIYKIQNWAENLAPHCVPGARGGRVSARHEGREGKCPARGEGRQVPGVRGGRASARREGREGKCPAQGEGGQVPGVRGGRASARRERGQVEPETLRGYGTI